MQRGRTLRCLLFLFLVSTTVVLVQASPGIDPATVQLLRALEHMKSAVLKERSGSAEHHGLDTWLRSGEHVPELLFLCRAPAAALCSPKHTKRFFKVRERTGFQHTASVSAPSLCLSVLAQCACVAGGASHRSWKSRPGKC